MREEAEGDLRRTRLAIGLYADRARVVRSSGARASDRSIDEIASLGFRDAQWGVVGGRGERRALCDGTRLQLVLSRPLLATQSPLDICMIRCATRSARARLNRCNTTG